MSNNWGTGTKLRKKGRTDKLLRLYSVPRKKEITQYLIIYKYLADMEELYNNQSGFTRTVHLLSFHTGVMSFAKKGVPGKNEYLMSSIVRISLLLFVLCCLCPVLGYC